MTKRSYRDDVRGVSAATARLRRSIFLCMGDDVRGVSAVTARLRRSIFLCMGDDVRGVSAATARLRRSIFYCMGVYFDHRPLVGLSVRPAGVQPR